MYIFDRVYMCVCVYIYVYVYLQVRLAMMPCVPEVLTRAAATTEKEKKSMRADVERQERPMPLHSSPRTHTTTHTTRAVHAGVVQQTSLSLYVGPGCMASQQPACMRLTGLQGQGRSRSKG